MNKTRYVHLDKVLGLPNYWAGSDGSIWSCNKHNRNGKIGQWRKLKTPNDQDGHLRATMFCNSQRRQMFVHQVILMAFVGTCPDGLECRHLDGNPYNNSLSNLCWGTHLENMADKGKHGTTAKGETNGFSKLTESEVVLIRQLWQDGNLMKDIAGQFNTDPTNVSSIVKRKTWKHL